MLAEIGGSADQGREVRDLIRRAKAIEKAQPKGSASQA